MKSKDVEGVYQRMERFADLTKVFISQGKIERAKKCLLIAETLLISGSKEVQQTIQVVYVFSVSSYMELKHCNIKDLFPTSLKEVYTKQIDTSCL